MSEKLKELSVKLGKLLNGRLESEISINDEYWKKRNEIHQQMSELEKDKK